jgi:azurin
MACSNPVTINETGLATLDDCSGVSANDITAYRIRDMVQVHICTHEIVQLKHTGSNQFEIVERGPAVNHIVVSLPDSSAIEVYVKNKRIRIAIQTCNENYLELYHGIYRFKSKAEKQIEGN